MYLYAAVGTGKADNQLKFFRSVINKLPFESFLFSAVGPSEPLYNIHTAVKTATQGNELPTYGLPNLQTKKRNAPINKCIKIGG